MEDKKYVNITKVYTKRGDKGETDLLGGSAARKDSLKVESYGCVDEASSFIGVARYYCKNKVIKERLKGIQNKLLVLGGFLASDDKGKKHYRFTINSIHWKIWFYAEYNDGNCCVFSKEDNSCVIDCLLEKTELYEINLRNGNNQNQTKSEFEELAVRLSMEYLKKEKRYRLSHLDKEDAYQKIKEIITAVSH